MSDAYGTAPASGKTNTMAIVALVFAFLCPLIGIILGVVAKNQIKQTGEGGDGLATAAIIIGVVSMVLGFIINIAVLGSS